MDLMTHFTVSIAMTNINSIPAQHQVNSPFNSNTNALEQTSANADGVKIVEYSPVPEINETIAWLQKNKIHPMAVAPEQDPYLPGCHRATLPKDIEKGKANVCRLGADLKPIPSFGGKNPSFINGRGNAQIIPHQKYHQQAPDSSDLYKWFQDPRTGVGAIAGTGCVDWIDIDAKNFVNQEECDRYAFELISLIKQASGLEHIWIEKTPGGGWHIPLILDNQKDFTNFAFEPGGVRRGEFLGTGRFVVLSPTVRANGKRYERFSEGEIPLIDKTSDIGIYPCKEEVDNQEQKKKREAKKAANPDYGKPTNPQDNPWDIRNFAHFLEGYTEDGEWAKMQCPHHANANSLTSLRVHLPTGALKTWCGCNTKDVYKSALKKAVEKGYKLPDKHKFRAKKQSAVSLQLAEVLPPQSIEKLTHESNRSDEEVSKAMNVEQSTVEGNNTVSQDKQESEISQVENKDKISDPHLIKTTVEQTIFEGLFESGDGIWTVINDAFYKYTGMGYWKNIPDAEVEKLIALELQKLYTLRTIKDGDEVKQEKIFKYATETNKKNSFKYCRSALTSCDSEVKTSNEHLICFRNTTVDVRMGATLPHDKKHFLISSIDADYIPNCGCPDIYKNFITEVHGEEFLPLIQAGISMYIDPTSNYGYFLHFTGPSGSGKGTQIDLIGSFFGKECKRSLNSLSDVATPDKRHQNLTGVRFVSFPDVAGRQTNLEAFYELVDGGSLSGRALFSSHGYEKNWNVRFVFASVEPLQLENSGFGWDRRCIPIPTKERKGEPDPLLKSKLREKKAEILSWALSMTRDERDRILRNATRMEAIADLKHQQAMLSDNVQAFVEMALRPSPTGNELESAKVYEYYVAFCKASGCSPQSNTRFITHLRRLIPRHFKERTQKRGQGGKKINIPTRWQNIEPVNPNAFTPYTDERTQETHWRCLLRECCEGGWEEFKAFWQQQDLQNLSSVSSVCTQSENFTMRTPEKHTQQDLQHLSSMSSMSSPYPKDFKNYQSTSWGSLNNSYISERCLEDTEDTEDSSQKPLRASNSGVLKVAEDRLSQGEDIEDRSCNNSQTITEAPDWRSRPDQEVLKSWLQEVKDFRMLVEILGIAPLEAVKATAKDLPPEYDKVRQLVERTYWNERKQCWDTVNW